MKIAIKTAKVMHKETAKYTRILKCQVLEEELRPLIEYS